MVSCGFSFDRPDLVDWRLLKTCDIRDRLESAFSIVEREYGVTRLLDPEGKLILHSTILAGKLGKKRTSKIQGNNFLIPLLPDDFILFKLIFCVVVTLY